MFTRRAVLTLSAGCFGGLLASSACGRRRSRGFRGFAFVANEAGRAIAVVDIGALAVARNIPLDGAPSSIITGTKRPFVYALTPASGTVHEVAVDRLSFTRKLAVGATALGMQLSPDESALYVWSRNPRALFRIDLDAWKVDWRLALPEEPNDFVAAADNKTGAVSFGSHVRLVNLASRKLSDPMGKGDFGSLRFLADSRTMIAADRGARRIGLAQARNNLRRRIQPGQQRRHTLVSVSLGLHS